MTRLSIDLNPADHTTLRDAAYDARKPLATWAREVLLAAAAPKPKYDKYGRELDENGEPVVKPPSHSTNGATDAIASAEL